MNEAALDELIAAIETLERLFAEAQDDPTSPRWREMEQQLADMQEQIAAATA